MNRKENISVFFAEEHEQSDFGTQRFNESIDRDLFKCLILTLFLVFIPFSLDGQWLVHTKYRGYDSVYYAFHEDSGIRESRKSTLTFYPLIDPLNIINTSKRPFKQYKTGMLPINKQRGSQNYYSWTINLNSSISVTDNMVLYCNIYTDGIDSIYFWIKSGDKYYKYNTLLAMDYYQFPSEIPMNFFKSIDSNESLKAEDTFDQLTLLIRRKDGVKKYDCVVGDLKIYQSVVKTAPAKGMFFYGLTGKLDNYPGQKHDVLAPYGIGINSTINETISNQYYFELTSEENKDKHILELLYSILDKYPYFEERNVDREYFLEEINSMIQDSTKSFSEKIEIIKNQVNSINDPHFFFQREQRGSNSPSTELPFRIGRHFKGFFITAISNSCPPDITVGAQVTHIDSVNLEVLYNSLGSIQTNIQSVINRMSGDTITIKTVDGRSIVVTKQIGVTYPSNYYKPLRNFRFIDEKYAYYSFNYWTFREYIYFTNKLRSIKSEEVDAFIFDLRNNPGGQELVAYLIASMFIDQPRVFSNHSYYHEGNLIKESIIVTPNKNFQFNGKKVILLVNRGTVCASEIFIAVMKKYANAIIIGQEGTKGAYAALNNFYLPDGINISTNILHKIEFSDYQIDNKGILPDMYVYPYNPEDFFPHNDIIFQRALEYLRLTENNPFCNFNK